MELAPKASNSECAELHILGHAPYPPNAYEALDAYLSLRELSYELRISL